MSARPLAVALTLSLLPAAAVGGQTRCTMREGPGTSSTLSCADGSRAVIRQEQNRLVIQRNDGQRIRGVQVGGDWIFSDTEGQLGRVRGVNGPVPRYVPTPGRGAPPGLSGSVRLSGRPSEGRSVEYGPSGTTRLEYRPTATARPGGSGWRERLPVLPYRAITEGRSAGAAGSSSAAGRARRPR